MEGHTILEHAFSSTLFQITHSAQCALHWPFTQKVAFYCMRQDISIQSTSCQIVEGSQTDCSAMISYPDSTLPEAIQGDQEGVSQSVCPIEMNVLCHSNVRGM